MSTTAEACLSGTNRQTQGIGYQYNYPTKNLHNGSMNYNSASSLNILQPK